MQTVVTREAIEQILQGPALLLEHGGQHCQPHRGGDAVLVPHRGGIDAVAQGLLVAEDQARLPADPLEARQRAAEAQAVGLGDPAQQAGGDHGAGQDPVAREGSQLGGLLTQERADLIARQLTPAAGSVLVRDGGGATIRIGIVGDHQVRLDPPGLVQRQVERPGLLRVGEGDRREVRIRLELLSHLDDVGEPGSREHLTAGGPTHAVHRRQHDLHRGGGRHPSRLSGPLDVLLPDLRVDRLPARLRAGHGTDRADGVDRRSDLAVIGGNDLGPLT